MIQGEPKEVIFYGEYEEPNVMEKRRNVIRDEINALKNGREDAVGLIQGFSDGRINKLKSASEKLPGLLELSSLSSKVRVILYHVEGEIYVITRVYYNKSDSVSKYDIEAAVVRAKDVLSKKDIVLRHVEKMRSEENIAVSGGMAR